MSLREFVAGFVFMRPFWLIGLLLLPLVALAWRRWQGTSAWESYIPSEKLRYLSVATPTARSRIHAAALVLLGLAVVAMAGPSWRKIPLPVKQPRDALIIAFDLSPSMLGADITPDRLTRARLKLIDLLRLRQEGETALIAYSGDAYRVAPLTDDTATIEALVPSLHPGVMPAMGSNVEAAAAMAREMLTGASLGEGSLLIITDGIDPTAFDVLSQEINESTRFCILTVGTTDGVPIPVQGGFARDANGKTILASLNRNEIRSFANRRGGCFVELGSDDADLNKILATLGPQVGDELDASESTFDIQQDEGYWLILLLLPGAVLAFRRNVLFLVVVGVPLTTLAPSEAQAFEWADLWQSPDQRTVQRLQEGVEEYRVGDYGGAAEAFNGETFIDHYNRANAQALAGQLQEALDSYDQALALDSEASNARFNREVIERLLEEQEQNQQGQSSEEENDSSDQDQSDSADGGGESGGSESESQDSDSASQPDTESDPSAQDPSDQARAGEPEQPDEGADDPEESESASRQERDESAQDESEEAESMSSAEAEQQPLSDQSEQWLRNIPDDPGGLMRRKFEYQSEVRRQNEARGARRRQTTRY